MQTVMAAASSTEIAASIIVFSPSHFLDRAPAVHSVRRFVLSIFCAIAAQRLLAARLFVPTKGPNGASSGSMPKRHSNRGTKGSLHGSTVCHSSNSIACRSRSVSRTGRLGRPSHPGGRSPRREPVSYACNRLLRRSNCLASQRK
jgi:hypothetical protein